MTHESSLFQNFFASPLVPVSVNDAEQQRPQNQNMDDSSAPDWHLQAWIQLRGKKQIALMNELGWTKSKMNRIWHGEQRYNREIVNEVAAWLDIEPFELLMAPEAALAIRELRKQAAAIVANTPDHFLPRPPVITPLNQRGKRKA